MSLQITGVDDVLEALKNGTDIELVLVDRDEDCSEIRDLCEKRCIRDSGELWFVP